MEDLIKEQTSDNNTNPFYISVIIPCYNVEKYVKRCVDSVINQTLGLEHIQLIIVDDASTDRTLAILEEIETCYPDQILLIPLAENVGQGAARNIAM